MYIVHLCGATFKVFTGKNYRDNPIIYYKIVLNV